MEKTIIIAEAGVNHNGSIDIAKRLIDVAAVAGVDYVKFQTFKTENLVTRYAKQAEYQEKNTTAEDNSQFNMLKKLELTYEQHYELVAHCKSRGVKFLSTAFDSDSIELLSSLNLGIWKIPSGEITNYPYLKQIAQKCQPVILSTGMCTIDDISDAISVLTQNGLEKTQITVLHCNTQYPTPMKDVNLMAMLQIKDIFKVKTGYSDHTPGIEIPMAAVTLGACVIEKHFTMDKSMKGPDHKASLCPNELKEMVKAIRNIEIALGDGKKRISKSEYKNITIARKSIVASTNIKKGEVFSENNITTKRPGDGISPMKWNNIIGTVAIRDFEENEQIEV